MKNYHVELWDVENEYMTSRAVSATGYDDAARQCAEWARKKAAHKMVVKHRTCEALYYIKRGGIVNADDRGSEAG